MIIVKGMTVSCLYSYFMKQSDEDFIVRSMGGLMPLLTDLRRIESAWFDPSLGRRWTGPDGRV